MVQTPFDPLEHVGQASLTDVQAKHLGQERRQALVTDRVCVAQVRRQTLDGSPKGGARFHPGRHRGHIRLPTAGTPSAILLDPCDNGLDGWQLDLVIDGLERLPCFRHPLTAMGADLRLGDDHLVGVRVQGASPTGTTDTGLATRPLWGAGGGVGLARLRGRHTGIPGVLDRLPQHSFQLG
jgi:hypothetical protein